MTKFKIFTPLFLFAMWLITGTASGQEEAGGLFVAGRITTEQGAVGGAVIKLFRNGQAMLDYQVDNTGRFNLRFEFNNEYELIFIRPDNFPQKYRVSTTVPVEVLRRDRKFPPYPLDVNLFTEIKGLNTSFAEHTVLRIFYSADVDNFIHEVYYNNAQIKKLIEQAILQSQSVSREDDLLKRLTASELAALRRDYDTVLKKAGAEFDNGDYLLALDDYKMASRIFPSEKFPKDRIAEIRDLIAVLGLEAELERQQAEKYAQLISQADQQFKAREYPASRENYTQALYVRPDDAYATGQIAEIERLIADMQTRQMYGDIIAVADNAFKEKLWDESKKRYQEALSIRPEESYPQAQIALIDAEILRLSQMAEKQSTFESAVLNGDASYAKQFYPKAIEYYRAALAIRPDDPGVVAKIEKVEKEQKDINDKLFYDETIANADRSFKRLEYEQARELYTTALSVMPGQAHPQRQIDAIGKIVEQSREYDTLVARADASLAAENYTSARDDFRAAMEIRPGEKYPAQKIREIDAVLATMAKEDQQYRQLIATADKFFNARQFTQAKTEYQKAAAQKPADSYPPEMLGKIAELEAEQLRMAEEQRLAEESRQMAEQQQRDQRYQALVDEADRLVAANDMVPAVSKFRDAMEVKPQESYPLQRIEEIRGIIARQTEAQKTYDTAIATADRAFNQQRYAEARTGYQQAQQAKAAEAYPAGQLAKIDAIEAEQASQLAEQARQLAEKEAEQARQLAEKQAEQARLLAEKEAEEARQLVEEARQLAEKEAEEARKLAEKQAEQSRLLAEKEAEEARQLAEEARQLAEKEAEEARKLAEKQAEQARQLAEKQAADEAARLAAMEARDREYAEAIAIADGLFNQQQYGQSIAEYRKAAQVKPGESYPATKIAEADRLNSEMLAAQKTYDTAIATADRAFNQQRYAEARTGYQQAQQAKAAEAYPSGQLAKIDAIEAEQASQLAEQARQLAEKEAEQARQLAEKQAEQARLLAEKEAEEARQLAEEARQLAEKEAEEARKLAEKQAEQSRLLAEKEAEQARQLAEKQAADEAARLAAMEAKDREYAEAIAIADGLFNQQQYGQSIAEYRKAAQVKPEESYPATKIAEADRLNSEMLAIEAGNREYARLITLADRSYSVQDYASAAGNYRAALQIKPDETHPKARVGEIETILQQRASDERYRQMLLASDGFFRSGDWDQARDGYQKALEVKPEEAYPKQQIGKIDETLQKLAQRTTPAQPPAEATAAPAQTAPTTASPAVSARTVTDEAEALYQSFIVVADESFSATQYNVSRAWYYRALGVKPAEAYPGERIAEINRILGSRQLSQRDREYQQFINQGDESFRGDQLAVARGWYNRALTIIPGDEYARTQINEIQQLINSRLQGGADQVFAEYMNEGDKAFGAKNYSVARVWYQRARQLKPADTLSVEKLEEVRKALAGE